MTTLFDIEAYNTPIIPVRDPYWDEIVLGTNSKPDQNGQTSLFYDDSQEPPDPDDFPSINDYYSAWYEWERRYPELAVEVKDVSFINEALVLVGEQVKNKLAPQQVQWLERYWVERSGKKHYYYRYMWMQGRSIHRCYIGSVKSQKASGIAEQVRQAIARQESPSEIKELIRCSKLVTG